MTKVRKHPGRAIAAGILNGILFVAIPFLIANFILTVFLDLQARGIGGLDPYIASLEALKQNIVIFGGGITALAALRAFFPKGDIFRAGFGIGRQVFKYLYLAIVLSGGVWALEVPLSFGNVMGALLGFGGGGGGGGGGPTGSIYGLLDLSAIFTLLYIAVGVTAFHGVLEWFIYRKTLKAVPSYPSPYPGGAYDYQAPPPQDETWGPYRPP